MKNPTILKDELSLLLADKSAVITELRNAGTELKNVLNDIHKTESKREAVRKELLEETARLEDTRGRAVSVKGELTVSTQELKNVLNTLDQSKQKNSQETRSHLGRIKELEDEEAGILIEIARLKSLFDKNSKVYNEHESDRKAKIRSLDLQIKEKETALAGLTSQHTKMEVEEKKMTKDRLKREDKLRVREKNCDSKEVSLLKREEDLITMSKDMTIVYGRLKEIYSQIHPDVDLDKLIFKAI